MSLVVVILKRSKGPTTDLTMIPTKKINYKAVLVMVIRYIR